MKNYTKNDVVRFLSPFNIKEGDIVYIHSDLFKFGFYKNNKNDLCLKLTEEILYKAIYSIIGNSGTIIVPAYTNSWTENEVFSESNSIISTGIFSQYISKMKKSSRSQHGLFSLAGIGKDAKEILSGKNKSGFGKDSPFYKMHLKNTLLLLLGTNLNSFKDYVEVLMQVPYRYQKVFFGQISVDNKLFKSQNVHHVRFENQPFKLLNFVDSIGEKNLIVNTDMINLNLIRGIRAENAFKLLSRKLLKDKYSFIDGKIKNKKFLEIISLFSSSESIERYGIYFEAHNKNNFETWKFSIKNKFNIKSSYYQNNKGNILDIPLICNFTRIKGASFRQKKIKLNKLKQVFKKKGVEFISEECSFWVNSSDMKYITDIEEIDLNFEVGNFQNIESLIELEVGGILFNAVDIIFNYIESKPNFSVKKNSEINDFVCFLLSSAKSFNILLMQK